MTYIPGHKSVRNANELPCQAARRAGGGRVVDLSDHRPSLAYIVLFCVLVECRGSRLGPISPGHTARVVLLGGGDIATAMHLNNTKMKSSADTVEITPYSTKLRSHSV